MGRKRPGKRRHGGRKAAMENGDDDDNNAQRDSDEEEEGGGIGAVRYNVVREEDNEEIDSDGAFDSDDEKEFGDIFAKRDAPDDDELAGQDDEPTLLDMMEDSDDDGHGEIVEGVKAMTRKDKQQLAKNIRARYAELLQAGDDEEDEDDDEDDNEEDDDEDDDEEEDDDDEDDEDDEDDDEDEDDDDKDEVEDEDEEDEDEGETKTSRLMDLVDGMVEDTGKKGKMKRVIAAANESARKEGEFNVSQKKKLSMADMVKSLGSERKDLGGLKRRIEQVQDANLVLGTKKRHLEARAERQVGYERASEEVSKWVPTISENQRAASMSFPLNEPSRIRESTAQAVDGFKAKTDLEREVEEALQASGLADENRTREDEEKFMLEARDADPKQMRERQKELAKLKALMFYSEQKARRANKIKSKAYRRLKKRREAREQEKEMERLRKIDPEAVREMEERAALERAKERMTLRHKNTSKFIRGLLKHGGSRKDYTQAIIREQLDAERNLKRRMRTMNDDDDSDDEDDDEDAAANALRGADEMLQRKAGLLVSGIEADAKDVAEGGKSTKGLFGLQFMQRGLEREQAEAKSQATALLAALQEGKITAEEADALSGNAIDDSRQAFTGRKRFSVVAQDKDEPAEDNADAKSAAPKKGIKGVRGSVDARMSSGLDLESAGGPLKKHQKKQRSQLFDEPGFQRVEVNDEDVESADGASAAPKAKPKAKAKLAPSVGPNHAAKAHVAEGDDDDEEREANPWIDQDKSSGSRGVTKAQKKRAATAAKQGVADVKVNVAKSLAKTAREETRGKADKAKRKQQGELIRRAFAGTSTLAQDFEDEKEEQEERNAKAKMSKEETMFDKAGWGSWAGTDIVPRKKKTRAAPQPSRVQLAAKRQRSGAKHVVLSEKRNKKVTKYLVSDVPYPFTSRTEYEASLRNPLGSDFNTAYIFNKSIKPDVITRAGAIIDPISDSVKK